MNKIQIIGSLLILISLIVLGATAENLLLKFKPLPECYAYDGYCADRADE
jgi:hypothetical protein